MNLHGAAWSATSGRRSIACAAEEFLAAVDYNFPKPDRQSLGLTVAGGPSPLSGAGFCLLQVGVQARQSGETRHAPVHLVLLVDTSTSMRWGSRIEIVRRAVGELPRIIGAEDRVSLVTFDQAAHVLVENLGHYDLPPLLAAADSLSAQGATNIVAGLREAYGVARPSLGPNRPAARIVLLTDGLLDLEPSIAEKIQQQVAQAAGENMPLDVIDMGQQKLTDPQVAALATAGRATVHRAASASKSAGHCARSSPAVRMSWPARPACRSRSIPSRCWNIAWWGTSRGTGAACCRARWRPTSTRGRRPRPCSRCG